MNICGGLMKPVAVEKEHGEYIILHKCTKCGEIKRNKASAEDDTHVIIGIASQAV